MRVKTNRNKLTPGSSKRSKGFPKNPFSGKILTLGTQIFGSQIMSHNSGITRIAVP